MLGIKDPRFDSHENRSQFYRPKPQAVEPEKQSDGIEAFMGRLQKFAADARSKPLNVIDRTAMQKKLKSLAQDPALRTVERNEPLPSKEGYSTLR